MFCLPTLYLCRVLTFAMPLDTIRYISLLLFLYPQPISLNPAFLICGISFFALHPHPHISHLCLWFPPTPTQLGTLALSRSKRTCWGFLGQVRGLGWVQGIALLISWLEIPNYTPIICVRVAVSGLVVVPAAVSGGECAGKKSRGFGISGVI